MGPAFPLSLSRRRLSKSMADSMSSSRLSGSSVGTKWSLIRSLRPSRNTQRRAGLFQPDLAAKMRKSTEYSATLQSPLLE